MHPNMIYTGNMVPATFVYPQTVFVVPPTYADSPYCPSVTSMQPMPSSHPASSLPTPTCTPQPHIFPASRRKIIITRLPTTTTAEELHSLILRALSKHPSTVPDPYAAIENIDLQRHSDQKSRGYAYVILDSYTSAKVVIDKLNGYHWQSRKLEARLTKEPVETGDSVTLQGPLADINMNVNGNGHSSSHHQSTSRGRGREGGRSKSSGGGEKRSSDKHTSASSEMRSSRSSGEKKHRTKDGESGKRTSKSESGSESGGDGMPLVVDGSSHRHQR